MGQARLAGNKNLGETPITGNTIGIVLTVIQKTCFDLTKLPQSTYVYRHLKLYTHPVNPNLHLCARA